MKTIDKIVKIVAFVNEVLQIAREKYTQHFPVQEKKEPIQNETETQQPDTEMEK